MRTCQPFMISLLLCCPSGGCASIKPITPEQVVTAYGEAAPSSRKAWWADPDQELGLAVGETQPHEVQRRAHWRRPGHPEVSVVRVDGRWQVTGGVLESRAAETPVQALKLFSRAVTAMDPALLRGLIPVAERTHWSAARLGEFLREPQRRPALLALVERLAAVSPESIGPVSGGEVAVGDEAGQIVLVRESDGWKVLDLRPPERFLPARTPEHVPE